MLPKYSIYTHLIGTENQFQLWQAAMDRSGCSSTSTVPKFIYRHWRQFCLSKLRNIPVCCLLSTPTTISHPASRYLRHIFHTLVYESKLTAGRLLFKLWKKWLWIEHVALRLLGAPRLQSFLEWCISKVEKRKIFKTKKVEEVEKVYIFPRIQVMITLESTGTKVIYESWR